MKRAARNHDHSQHEPGGFCEPLNSLLQEVRRGILIARFSGGRPNDNGDFSGVAKNNHYIENGVLKYPISETMISGNMAELLNNIVGISRTS